ncbi:hypothetical protein QR680_004953 [Steinernema hermaphroditum]|uniref:Sulfotransferase domain-containing protein n=1 Tax=Steinernema hermaphroditum TaxID=289476 RepID=A0AA39HSJ8_9BILA|nr:hypothetical protein QR680_004953 [Steinernema hermaphroditum]
MTTDSRAEFAEAVLALVFYVLYRILRALIQLESDLFVLVKKALLYYRKKEVVGGDQLEVSTILARKRFHLTDLARDVDFLSFFEHWESIECLEDPRWMVYTVTRKHAYFVKMPNSSIEYAVEDSAFLGPTMFQLADKVARIPIDAFIEQSRAYRNFKGKVIVISTMARSGSTLMAKMLQATDHTRRDILVFSEPDVFSVIATMIDDFSGIDLWKGRRLLLATTRFMCKDQLRDQTVVLKMKSNCTRLVPHFHAVTPSVMHLFLARDQLEHSLVSQMLFAHHSPALFKMVLILRRTSPALCAWITTWCQYETRMVNMIDPRSVLEFALAIVCRSVIDYKLFRKFFSTPIIYYEEMVSETVTTLRRIFSVCGLSDLQIPESIACKRKNSGNPLGKQLSSEEKAVVKRITEMIGFYDSLEKM